MAKNLPKGKGQMSVQIRTALTFAEVTNYLDPFAEFGRHLESSKQYLDKAKGKDLKIRPGKNWPKSNLTICPIRI